MSLADWQKFGWLKVHRTNRNEIAELMAVVDRDLAASETPGLHNDWSFNIAYNAALQLATAALAASPRAIAQSTADSGVLSIGPLESVTFIIVMI